MSESRETFDERVAAEHGESAFSLHALLGKLGALARKSSGGSAENSETQDPIHALVNRENDYIANRSQANLLNRLRFPVEHTLESSEIQQLIEQYDTELKLRTGLLDRYALFMDDRFSDYTFTLDLAETTEAASHKAIAELKEQYGILRDKLQRRGTIDGEIPRENAEIEFFIRRSEDDGFVVVERNRKLVCFERDGAKVSLNKRMTFLLPQADYLKLNGSDHKKLTDNQARQVQDLVDAESDVVIPIRTVYFAAKKFPKNSRS